MDSISQILFDNGSFSKIIRSISEIFVKSGINGHVLPIRYSKSCGYESIIAGGIAGYLECGIIGSYDIETLSSYSPVFSLIFEKQKGGNIIIVFDNITCGKIVHTTIQLLQQRYGFSVVGIASINSPSHSKQCMIEISTFYSNIPLVSIFRDGILEHQQQQTHSFLSCDCNISLNNGVDNQNQKNENGINENVYSDDIDNNAMETENSSVENISAPKVSEDEDEVVVVMNQKNSTISVVDFKEQDDNVVPNTTKESIFLQSDTIQSDQYSMEEVSPLALVDNIKNINDATDVINDIAISSSLSSSHSNKPVFDINQLTIRHFASATVIHQTTHEAQIYTDSSSASSTTTTTNQLLMEQVENGPHYWIARVSANSPCEDAFVVSHCNEINAWLYSVVDGHGGPLVGVLVRDRIANVIFEHLSKALIAWDSTHIQQNECKGSIIEENKNEEKQFEMMIQSTLTQAILALDDIITEIIKEKSIEALQNVVLSEQQDDNDDFSGKKLRSKSKFLNSNGSPMTPAAKKKKILKGIWNSGCCCCFAVVLRDKLWVGNLGDCRALLIRKLFNDKKLDNTISSSTTTKSREQNQQPALRITKPMSDHVMARINDHSFQQSQNKHTPRKRNDQELSHIQEEKDIGYNTDIIVLSRDHTCDDPREADDVRRRSGDPSAIRWNGGQADPLRVDGTLVPTRAFGNTFLKGYAKEGPDESYGWPRRAVYITAEPEYIQPAIKLIPSESPVLVLASDGLWAWTSNDEVGAMIHSGCNAIDLVEVALELAGKHSGMSVKDLEAREQGKERRMVHDDITVLVIDIFSQL